MIIFIDVDNTICKSTSMEYNKAEPIINRIKKANEWYD
jgi:nicotinamidase-related amidase